MKCYFLRGTEEWEGVLENTDHPKALCPDKKKVIMNLFASRWESRTLNFSNKKHWLYLYRGVNQLHQCCRGRGGSQGNTWNTQQQQNVGLFVNGSLICINFKENSSPCTSLLIQPL